MGAPWSGGRGRLTEEAGIVSAARGSQVTGFVVEGFGDPVTPGRIARAGPRTEPTGASRALEGIRRLLEVEVARPIRRLPGRETFLWPETDPRLVVKRTRREPRREGLVARLHGDPRSAGEREFKNLAGLAADGIPVPRPLGWVAEHGESGRRSIVVMEYIPHAETLEERLGRCPPDERQRWREALVRHVVRLHAAGWYHRDLYLCHWILPAPEVGRNLVLLDVGRARKRLRPRRRWFVKDLGALLHSTPEAVPTSDRMRFAIHYLDAREVHGSAERRAWLRDVERRRRRIAAHVPRHGEAPPGAGP